MGFDSGFKTLEAQLNSKVYDFVIKTDKGKLFMIFREGGHRDGELETLDIFKK